MQQTRLVVCMVESGVAVTRGAISGRGVHGPPPAGVHNKVNGWSFLSLLMLFHQKLINFGPLDQRQVQGTPLMTPV